MCIYIVNDSINLSLLFGSHTNSFRRNYEIKLSGDVFILLGYIMCLGEMANINNRFVNAKTMQKFSDFDIEEQLKIVNKPATKIIKVCLISSFNYSSNMSLHIDLYIYMNAHSNTITSWRLQSKFLFFLCVIDYIWDTYGCVDFYKQPAFDNLSMKNHSLYYEVYIVLHICKSNHYFSHY